MSGGWSSFIVRIQWVAQPDLTPSASHAFQELSPFFLFQIPNDFGGKVLHWIVWRFIGKEDIISWDEK